MIYQEKAKGERKMIRRLKIAKIVSSIAIGATLLTICPIVTSATTNSTFEEKDSKKIDSYGEYYIIDNKGYVTNSLGVPQKDIVIVNSKLNKSYYVDEYGKLATGFFYGKTYNAQSKGQCYADEDGVIQTMIIVKDDYGNSYYFDSEGKMVKSNFIYYGSKKYYAGKSGLLQTGDIIVDENKYYADENGVIQKEYKRTMPDGKMYYYDFSGQLVKNDFYIDESGNKYYANEKGEIHETNEDYVLID